MNCAGCGEPILDSTTTSVWHKECFERRLDHLPDDRYLLALKRIYNLIKSGRRLKTDDCTDIGNKHTECTWGLCSAQRDAWPDAQDHLFPADFRLRGRMSPLYMTKRQRCPLEMGSDEHSGCFYRCLAFQERKACTRETVLAAYEKLIAEWEKRLCTDQHQT